MDRSQIEEDATDAVPQDFLADIQSGLDDLKHSRGVAGEVALARLDAMIAAAKARRTMPDNDGESRSNV